MKIRTKLTLGFVGIALLAGFIGIIAIFQNNNTKRIAEEEVYRSILHLDDVWGLMEAQEHQEILVKDFLFVQRGLKEKRSDYFHEKERWTKIYQKYYTESCEHVKPLVKKYYESMEKYNAAVEEAFELYGQGADLETLQKKAMEADKYAEIGHKNALKPIIEHVHKAHIEPAKENIAKGINKTTTITIVTSIVAVFAAIGLGLFISRSISNPLCALQKKSEMIGRGNLDVRAEVKSKDEIGELAASFNKMAEDLSRTTASMDELNEEIANRKQTEDKLVRVQAAVNNAKDSIVILDLAGKIYYVNPAFVNMFKISLELIDAQNIEAVFADQNIAIQAFQDASESNSWVGETEMLVSNHDKFPAYLRATPITDKESNVLGVLFVINDITELKETEEKLRQSQRQLKSILKSLPTGIVIIDEKTHVIEFVNPIAAKMIGVEAEQILGQICHKYICPAEKGKCPITDLKQDVDQSEKKMLRANGEVIDILKSVNHSIINDKKCLVESFFEITEIKKAEKRQAKLLEQVESINDELKSFAYIISHDLKAPLRGISSLADWLSDDYREALGDDGKQQMDLLKSRVGRMQDLIEGVLQYSRVGRVKEDIVDVELKEVVPEVIDLLAAPDNISITVDDDLPVISAEKTRISQLFQNILSNSIKYMDKPEGQIRIGCVEDGNNWRFSLSDNGPGIEEKHFEKIFQIFQTISDSDSYESTGVGLSVVKKIVEVYGGSIWVESEVGNGCTFYFKLPKENKYNSEEA